MKTKTPQFELPGTEDAFNLAIETTQDGERAAREAREAKIAKDEAARRQRDFLDSHFIIVPITGK